MALDKAAILAELQLQTERIPFGAGEVIVSEISAPEYLDIYNSPLSQNDAGEFDGTKFTALLTARCIVDEEGKRVFDDADADAIKSGASARYRKLVDAVNRINGLGGDTVKN